MPGTQLVISLRTNGSIHARCSITPVTRTFTTRPDTPLSCESWRRPEFSPEREDLRHLLDEPGRTVLRWLSGTAEPPPVMGRAPRDHGDAHRGSERAHSGTPYRSRRGCSRWAGRFRLTVPGAPRMRVSEVVRMTSCKGTFGERLLPKLLPNSGARDGTRQDGERFGTVKNTL